jgi:predicted LPLAT superfamily acyltransferase
MSEWKGKTRGGLLGYKIFIFILKKLGLSAAYLLVYPVAVYFLFFSIKKYLYYFYRQVMKYGRLKAVAAIFKNYIMLGKVILDRIAALSGNADFTFDFDGEEYLQQMAKTGKGGLLISAHLGNWEIAGNLLHRIDATVYIVMYDAEHERIKEYLRLVETKKSMQVIVIKDDLSHIYEISSALENKGLVCIHADRFVPGTKQSVGMLMEKPAPFPAGPFILAMKFAVPVSFVFAMKESRHHYHFYASQPAIFPTPASISERKEVIKQMIAGYTDELDKKIKKYPFQWFNYHDFWQISKKA